MKDRSSLASETGILMKYVLQNFNLINAYFTGNYLKVCISKDTETAMEDQICVSESV